MSNQSFTKAARGSLRRSLGFAAALLVGTAAVTVAPVPAYAQESNASLRGTITSGGTAAEASQVVAIEVDTGARRTAVVRSDGSYNLASLRPGTYRLEITTPSGVRQTDEFTLQVAQNAVLDIDLAAIQPETAEVSSAEAGTIIVTANRIRTMEGGEVGTTITQREIEQLPQINRNFLAFADLAPGVQFVNPDGQSRLQGGAQDSRTVNVFIDGIGQKDYVLKNGITGQDSTQGNPFPQLAVGEYRVISSNYKAEFDQVSSVAITAVTKSGTNEFHGEAFVDYTNTDLRERRPTEIFCATVAQCANLTKIETKDLQFGGALGGPIIKDIAHFFVTYEGKRRLEPRDINPGLDLPITFFPPQYQGFFGSANEEFNENLYFGKVDFSPTGNNLIEASVKYRDEYGDQFGGGIAAYETRTIRGVEELRGLLRWEHSHDNFINDAKIAYEDVTWNPAPVTNEPSFIFNVTIADPSIPSGERRGDILRIGGANNFQDKGQKGWTAQDDFTWIGFEGHTIKAGAKLKWVTLNTFEQNFFNPIYRFYAGNFRTGNPPFNDTIPFEVQFNDQSVADNAAITSKNFQLGLYIQDDWEVTDRLTLNLGLRWDYERTPAFLDYVHAADRVAAVRNDPGVQNTTDYDIEDYISTGSERKAFLGAWQPRIGFSYEIDSEGRFVLFGGYGRAYDRHQFDFIQSELAQGPNSARTFRFLGAGEPNPCTPSSTCVPWNPIYLTQAGLQQLLAGAPPGAGGALRFINNDLKAPYSDQFSLGLRSRFARLWEGEIGYTYIISKDGFVYFLGNRRPDGSFFPATGSPSAPFNLGVAPFNSNLLLGDNGRETRSNSAYLKLNKRYTSSSPWSLAGTYTYTKAKENREFGEAQFAFDFPTIDDYPFLPSLGVRKHRLVMTGTVDVPFGLTLSGKFQIASPRYLNRFTAIAGDPLSRDIESTLSEGNGDRWGFRQMDVALTKYVPLGFLTDETQLRFRVDVINLFNDRNYNSFNAVTGLRNPSAFGTDGPPRTIKLSTGFSF